RMASLVEHALDTVPCEALLVPTRGGTTARAISRFKPPVWVIAPSRDPRVLEPRPHAATPPCAKVSPFLTASIRSILWRNRTTGANGSRVGWANMALPPKAWCWSRGHRRSFSDESDDYLAGLSVAAGRDVKWQRSELRALLALRCQRRPIRSW